MVRNITSYFIIYIIVIIIAICLQLCFSTSLIPKVVSLYKRIKALRVTLWLILTITICYLFFQWTGDNFFSVLFLISSEYKHLTIASIMVFLILLFVEHKNRDELLDVFGSAAFICWLWAFVITASVHFIIQFGLIGKGIRLFDYLTEVIPGYYKILPYVILIICAINIYILLDITVRRTSKIISEYMKQKFRESYQEKILELTYSDEYENGLPAREQIYFKKVKRLLFTRSIFADELLRMHEMVYGVLHKRVHLYFDLLLLPNDAHNYLHSRHWYYKIKGLRIYAQLDNKKEIAYIKRLMLSKNNVLRSEAQLAMARLTEDNNPLYFLKDLQQQLTVWEQLNLIHYFTNFKKTVGDLSSLLASKNISVVTFGLHCIRIFNCFEYFDQILALTRHPDPNVQDVAFEALALHEDPEVVCYLISRYDNSLPLSTRLNILKTIGIIGDPVAVPFLKEQIKADMEIEICIELFKSLIQIAPLEAYNITISDHIGNLSRIYNHVIDSKI